MTIEDLKICITRAKTAALFFWKKMEEEKEHFMCSPPGYGQYWADCYVDLRDKCWAAYRITSRFKHFLREKEEEEEACQRKRA